MLIIQALRGQRQADFSEYQDSLVYVMSSRPTRDKKKKPFRKKLKNCKNQKPKIACIKDRDLKKHYIH